MQRKKSRRASLGIAGNNPIAWEKKKKKDLHLPPPPPHSSFRSDFEVTYNTSLRLATAGLLLKNSTISCKQYIDVLEMHMGLMQCGNSI